MSSRVKRTLWMTGIVIVGLAVVSGVGYLALRPKPLDPHTLPIQRVTTRVAGELEGYRVHQTRRAR